MKKGSPAFPSSGGTGKIRWLFSCSVLILACLLSLSLSVAGQSAKSTEEYLVELLNIRPGMIIADVGAGQGDLSILLADRVGAEGHVYANEISKTLIDMIEEKVKERGLRNVTVILGEEEDPRLPDKTDVIILNFVYHHLSKPEQFMLNALKYLKPSGRLVITAYDVNKAREKDPELKLKGNQEACVSDPLETRKAIEKAGYVFERQENFQRRAAILHSVFQGSRSS